MKILTLCLLSFLTFSTLPAEIVQTNRIEDVLNYASPESLVLFNIAEVLTDSSIDLGTQAWRKDLRKRAPELHDQLTLFVFDRVPSKAVDPQTAFVIQQLQDQNIATLAFTSRGRSEWYSTQVEGVDYLTERVLKEVDIDFSRNFNTILFSDLENCFSKYFHNGIIYTTNSSHKGNVLQQALACTKFAPSRVILVDDKRETLETLEHALNEMGIEFIGIHYEHTAWLHQDFNLVAAYAQLDWLLSTGQILSDDEARKIAHNLEPQFYISEVLEKWDVVSCP